MEEVAEDHDQSRQRSRQEAVVVVRVQSHHLVVVVVVQQPGCGLSGDDGWNAAAAHHLRLTPMDDHPAPHHRLSVAEAGNHPLQNPRRHPDGAVVAAGDDADGAQSRYSLLPNPPVVAEADSRSRIHRPLVAEEDDHRMHPREEGLVTEACIGRDGEQV